MKSQEHAALNVGEIPIELPKEWMMAQLGKLCDRHKQIINPSAFPNEPFEYYSIPAFQENGRPSVTTGREILSQKTLVTDGTVLFGKLNPRVPKVWRVRSQTPYRKIASTEFLPLSPKEGIDGEFLVFLCSSSWVMDVAKGLVGGSTPSRQRVDPSAFYDIDVPRPPFPEQRAIAAVLSKIQTAVEVQDKLVTTLKELKAATMAKLFREGLRGERLKQTEIGEIPESWEVLQLGKIAQIGNGSTPKRDNLGYWDNGSIPWLTSAKVHESVIESADEFVTEAARSECHLPMVRKGSLVVAITGQGKTLGNVAMVKFDTCVSQHLAFIQFQTDKVVPEFMLYFLQGKYGKFRQVSQAGGSTKGALTCGFLKGYAAPVPSPEEQRQIATILGTLGIRLRAEEARRQALKSLFSSMLHLLMTGQVRVNESMVKGAVEEVTTS